MPVKYTTPSSVPEGVACRQLKVPNNGIWLGIFNSALLETVNKYNWEQTYDTDLTIEETVLICQAIIDEYWTTSGCGDPDFCAQPDGSRIVRQNATGHWEELAGNEWQEPTGDYEVPPVPPREESTAYERKCLAAANAQNVLEIVYEEASDAINEGLDQGEVVALIIAEVGALIGLFGGLFAAAVFGLVAAALRAFLELMEFLTSDVWDDGFSDVLRCVLYDCATDTADVVTFDLQCVYDKLAQSFDPFDPDAYYHIRLVNQVAFMLSFIGADGLNAAGATTEVESANCDACIEWCYEWDFADGDGDWLPIISSTTAPLAVYSAGAWRRVYNNGGLGFSETRIYRTFDETNFTISSFEIWYEVGLPVEYNVFWGEPTTLFIHETVEGDACKRNEVLQTIPDLLRADMGVIGDTTINIYKIRIRGGGESPFGADNCGDDECEEP